MVLGVVLALLCCCVSGLCCKWELGTILGDVDCDLSVCQELGMSKGWVYQRIRSGQIPHVKLGHNIKVRREDLQAYLQAQRRESIEE